MDYQTQLREKQQLVCGWLEALAPRGEGAHALIHDAANYSLLAGGKRLRPVLTVAVCELLGQPAERARHFACAVECIHAASLIHDDLPCMDDDDLRRGKPTNHKQYGEAMALLAGDALITYAFELIAHAAMPPSASLAACRCLAEASGANGMIGGQVIDIAGVADEESLIRLHRMKTGALIAAAVQMGGIAGGATGAQLEALTRYATNLGLAFQIQDDMLDVIGQPEQLGKPIGSDAGKCTFVTLFGVDGARHKLEYYTAAAKEALQPFGEGGAFLLWLADYLLKREQ